MTSGEMAAGALFARWCAAWVSRDHEERLRHLQACCADDLEFVPGDSRPALRGWRALADHITAHTARWPAGVTAELVAPLETHHDWCRGYIRWTFPQAVAVGCDVARINGGKISTMIVFVETRANAEAVAAALSPTR
jgi:hypothetical protein